MARMPANHSRQYQQAKGVVYDPERSATTHPHMLPWDALNDIEAQNQDRFHQLPPVGRVGGGQDGDPGVEAGHDAGLFHGRDDIPYPIGEANNIEPPFRRDLSRSGGCNDSP